MTDLFRFVVDEGMNFNPISISGYHMREAGATAAQEVGFTLANALEYVKRAVAAGLAIERFGPRLSFFFAAHNDLFEEVAKFRAARRLWARLVRERFGADDQTCRLRFHTQTGGVTLQAQQPLNNVVRVTVQALGGRAGWHPIAAHQRVRRGAGAAHRRVGHPGAPDPADPRRTRAGVDRVVDPLGGSYYVEALTGSNRARRGGVDRRGGCTRWCRCRNSARLLPGSHCAERLGIAATRRNRATSPWSGSTASETILRRSASSAPISRRSPSVRRRRLQQVKARRDAGAVTRTLAAISEVAASTGPLMPPIIDAVRARATLGEISDTLRNVWGVYGG